MNPGYLSYVLLLCGVIMAVFGWKNQLFGSMRRLHAWILFLGWILSYMHVFQFSNVSMHGTLIWIGAIAVISLRSVRTGGEALLHISAMSLFASIFLLFQRLSDFYPHLAIFSTPLNNALVLSLFVSMTTKDAKKQIAVLSGGLFIGEWMYMKLAQPVTAVIGGLDTADLWWLTFMLARVWSGAAWACVWMFKTARKS